MPDEMRSEIIIFSLSSTKMCHKQRSEREGGTCSLHHVFEPQGGVQEGAGGVNGARKGLD